MENNERIEKDCKPCPRCNNTKRWLPRDGADFQYVNNCTKCGYIWVI